MRAWHGVGRTNILASPAGGKLSSECETDEGPAENYRSVCSSSAPAGERGRQEVSSCGMLCRPHLPLRWPSVSPAGSAPVWLSMSTGHRFTTKPRCAPLRGKARRISISRSAYAFRSSARSLSRVLQSLRPVECSALWADTDRLSIRRAPLYRASAFRFLF